jgi:hypothetical protein
MTGKYAGNAWQENSLHPRKPRASQHAEAMTKATH